MSKSIEKIFQKLSVKHEKKLNQQQQQQQQQQPAGKRMRTQDKPIQQYQQYMVPFLFQQSVDKNFKELNLYYYDEEWSPVRQDRSSISMSLQDQFPNLHQVQKTSASQSIVYRGTHKGRKVFVKSFRCGRSPTEFEKLSDGIKALSYEKEVYRRIRHVSETDDEIRRHFIQMLFCTKDKTNGVAYVFSQDSGGRSFEEYLQQERLTCSFLAGIMTQYLYILHLLHDKLHITHNDLHAGNLMVLQDNEPQKTYTFGGQTFHLTNHPYTLMVYDFDQSSMYEPASWRNLFITYICDKYGRCPNYPATDLYTYLLMLIDYGAPKQYMSTQDEVKHNLLITAYQDLMPDDLFRHVEKVSEHFHYAPCKGSTWDGKCILPRSPPTLPQLANLWHQAIHTKTERMNVIDAMPVLLDMKNYFGKFIFLIRKPSKLHITTNPNTNDLQNVHATNQIIAIGGMASLIPAGLSDEDADGIRELFLAQYANSSHVKKLQQRQKRGGTTGMTQSSSSRRSDPSSR